MHSPRPLANLKIDELTAVFLEALALGDRERLEMLRAELARRKSPGASSLAARVTLALARAA